MSSETFEEQVRDALRGQRDRADTTKGHTIVDGVLRQHVAPRAVRWSLALFVSAAAVTVAALLIFQPFSGGGDQPDDGLAAANRSSKANADGTGTASATDCLSDLVVEGTRYSLALGSSIRSLTLGELAGEGLLQPCSEAIGGTGESRRVDVYGVHGIPVRQALLIQDADGTGALFIASDLSAGEVDPDLDALLHDMGVARP